ncbi:MAG: ABC transporter ATP-binding protein [Candidatus Hodarchaeota archaeon]
MISLLRLENVSFSYSKTLQEVILKSIKLEVREKDFVLITGPSGSGKSTLLNLIGLFFVPDQGKIWIKNQMVNLKDRKRVYRLRTTLFGFVFQQGYLHDGLTVEENIELPLRIAKSSSQLRIERTKILLDIIQLQKRKNHYPSELSRGEQQRVGIARALALDPPVILADEPTSHVDSKLGEELVAFFVDLNQKFDKTIIVATHDLSFYHPFMTQLNLIDGKIVPSLS